MSSSFEFPDVERVTVGTVGQPGQRTFYLQVRHAQQLVTLKMEKQQVAALAQLLAQLLSDLPTPEAAPTPAPDLEEPVLAEWPVGAMGLAYDQGLDRVVLLAEEVAAAADDESVATPGDDGVARIAITRGQAAALVIKATQLVSSGRPDCPLCGNPMDPTGHSCPRTNGHGPKH
jgi:uncharacterized repeat protein (TIGR03847 family)